MKKTEKNVCVGGGGGKTVLLERDEIRIHVPIYVCIYACYVLFVQFGKVFFSIFLTQRNFLKRQLTFF